MKGVYVMTPETTQQLKEAGLQPHYEVFCGEPIATFHDYDYALTFARLLERSQPVQVEVREVYPLEYLLTAIEGKGWHPESGIAPNAGVTDAYRYTCGFLGVVGWWSGSSRPEAAAQAYMWTQRSDRP